MNTLKYLKFRGREYVELEGLLRALVAEGHEEAAKMIAVSANSPVLSARVLR